jgi:hypothetical protein
MQGVHTQDSASQQLQIGLPSVFTHLIAFSQS